MTRFLWIPAILIVVGIFFHQTGRGQVSGTKPGEVGPGAGGATLKLPGYDAPPSDKPAVPDSLKGMWNTSAFPNKPNAGNASKVALPPSNQNDINTDIEITPAAGNWMIFAMAYTGPKAPEMARKFVAALRGHYKMNAYVFNYGAKEKQEEYERVEKIRKEQVDALEKAGLKADVPIRVAAMKIDEQTGVLVGGYKSRDEAMKALEKFRKLDPNALLEHKIDLDSKFVIELDGKQRKEAAYVNPFLKAFPARNPTIPSEQISGDPEADLRFFRKVNDGESFSLLQCKKPYTLVVKQFNMQYKTLNGGKEGKEEARTFLERFEKGLTLGKDRQWEDVAANNAHKLAESFRKAGLPETYVLHAKHCSFVTVGNYDRPDAPKLLADQNYLENTFKTDSFRQLEMFSRPMIMPVPGVAK